MARPYFYHSIIRKLVVAFGTIFDEIDIRRTNGDMIRVPLHYAPRSKLLDNRINADMDELVYDTTLPRMGFELVSFNLAIERMLNSLERIDYVDDTTDSRRYTMNRIPYDFQFDLHLATLKLEDSLQVVEQIVPFFSPELNLTIHDMPEFDLKTNIPVVLNSMSLTTDYEGSLDTRRVITWTLSFTVKAYLYSDIRNEERIKKSVVNMHNDDFKTIFDRFTAYVDPFEASRGDPHTIRELHEEGRLAEDG